MIEVLSVSAFDYRVVTDVISVYADYDSFAREWHSDTLTDRGVTLDEARERNLINEQDTRQLWQLLGLLDEDEVFIQLPEWLAKEKTDDTDDVLPTMFIGRLARETGDAILFKDSSPGRRLMHISHRIHSLERGRQNTAATNDRRERLDDNLQEEYQRFENQDAAPYLSDEWLPKSQLITAIQRRER